MQTFLAYPDYFASGQVLDKKRLGNQVYREALTLVNGGWPHHPASKMWRGYEYSLCNYALALIDVMELRNWHSPGVVPRWRDFFSNKQKEFSNTGIPPWIGREEIHSSHRAVLLAKDANWYSNFQWSETPAVKNSQGKWPYIWPV